VAHGTTTQFGSRTALAEIFTPGFVDCVYRNNQLLGLTVNGSPVFPELPGPYGSNGYGWKINSAGNTSTSVFAESAVAPTPVAQTYVNANVTATYFWAWTRVTGHVRDLVANGAIYPGLDPIQNEFAAGFEDIRDLVNTSFMGGTYGLELAVDDGATYAGIARGSAAYFECSNTNQNGALTRAGLLNTHEAARDNDKGGGPTFLILVPHNQLTNYLQLTGEPNAQNSSVRVEFATVGGGRLDLAPAHTGLSFMGSPIVGLGDFTNTTWLALDLRMTRHGPNVGIKTVRTFDIRGPDMAGDDDVYELSHASACIVHMPKLCWKLEDVTA
jgi:hypothetical protein